jgi:hypothetical protein
MKNDVLFCEYTNNIRAIYEKKFLIIALFVLSAASQAKLILHISPDGPTGTRWEFTGFTTVDSAGSTNSFWGQDSRSLSNTFGGSHSIASFTITKNIWN